MYDVYTNRVEAIEEATGSLFHVRLDGATFADLDELDQDSEQRELALAGS